MLILPPTNDFGLIIYSTADGTRPSSAGMGASVTPAQNAYGTYATLISGASLTDDVYDLEININNVGISASARDCVVSLGLDSAGGTSYTGIADLVCGPASPYGTNATGGVWFRFPLFIKAGTSIGIAGAVNSATLTAFSAFCYAHCRPSRPDLIFAGSYIDSYGVTLASSSGTALTPGTTTEGTYVSIGTLTRSIRYLDWGYGINNSVMSTGMLHVDLAAGDNTNKRTAVTNWPLARSTTETISKSRSSGRLFSATTGDTIYARSQDGSAPETGHSVAAYGVGG